MLVNLSRRIDAVCVAEGIETPEDLEECRRLGIPYGQGFYLGVPAEKPADEPAREFTGRIRTFGRSRVRRRGGVRGTFLASPSAAICLLSARTPRTVQATSAARRALAHSSGPGAEGDRPMSESPVSPSESRSRGRPRRSETPAMAADGLDRRHSSAR